MADNFVDDSDSSSDSDSESEIPTAEVCDGLCKEFAAVTSTDSVMAMMYLQRNHWSLEKAVEKYFHDGVASSPSTVRSLVKPSSRKVASTGSTSDEQDQTVSDAVPKTKISTSKETNPETEAASDCAAKKDENPFRIRILSWNIDGLDTNNFQNRTTGACNIIKEINPDVVYLQEVVPKTLEIITSLMNKAFLCIAADEKAYFTMILLNRATVMHESHQVTPFYSSKMGRNILECEVNIKGIPFYLMTVHLESTGPHKTERLRQTKKCLDTVGSCQKSRVVVFGGDLNARDKEMASISFPRDVVDIWTYCGQREDAKYTWDTLRNDNLCMMGGFKARCRFDRLYFRADDKKSVKPVYFELVGLKRLESCRRFVSDHWGILSHYDIVVD